MNGLKTDFDGSGVAVNQWTLGLPIVNTETWNKSYYTESQGGV